MVRKGGLEPPRPCDRQPLKLVRLPIPPLPHEREISIVSVQFTLARQREPPAWGSTVFSVAHGQAADTETSAGRRPGCLAYFLAGAGVAGICWNGVANGDGPGAWVGAGPGAGLGADFMGAFSSTDPVDDFEA